MMVVQSEDGVEHRMALFRKYPIGDSCLCWSMASSIDPEVTQKILWAYRRLKHDLQASDGFRDLVPSYTALALHFDPLSGTAGRLVEVVEDILFHTFSRDFLPENLETPGKLVRLKVVYDGPDLQRVAERAGLTVREAVKRHKAPCYTVAMMGFIPHFPYLMGLDTRLETPRLPSPRTRVPAGSVAIGGAQTGVYPSESPGGWNLIGTTDPGVLADLEPGDRVIFFEEFYS